jgi:hypothetical protein
MNMTLNAVATARNGHETHPLGFQAVRTQAPAASGIYTLYTSRQWIYVGESDDIRQSLFRHLNDMSVCIARRGALSFSFEIAPATERVARQRTLVTALSPVCQGHATGKLVETG